MSQYTQLWILVLLVYACRSDVCLVGQYLNPGTRVCQPCSKTNTGCGSCANSTYCYQCSQGYFLRSAVGNTRGCDKCSVNGCLTCDANNNCFMCNIGFYLNGNSCPQCTFEGCLRCTSNSNCEQCNQNYYLDAGGSCRLCRNNITGCQQCTSSTTCLTCIKNYYLDTGGVCQKCPSYCYLCNSPTNCTDCVLGYYLVTAGAVRSCEKCPTPGCATCNESTGVCMECNIHKYLTVNMTCQLCAFPCAECNSVTCLACLTGFYLNFTGVATSGGNCLLCQFPCQTCNSSSVCVSCALGYYLKTSTRTCQICTQLKPFCLHCSETQCLKCSKGYYFTGGASKDCLSCASIMYSCVDCFNSTKCLACATGSFLTTNSGNSSCGTCPIGCALCNSSAYCFGCLPSYYLDTTLDQCLACVIPCVTCTSPNTCVQCQQRYYLNGSACLPCLQNLPYCLTCSGKLGTTIQCTSCATGYAISAGSCVACVSPCTLCNSTRCFECQLGYFLTGGAACQLCPQNCTACTGLATCSQCSLGFYLSGSLCLHCSTLGCLTCTPALQCLSCTHGQYLTATKTCRQCTRDIPYCSFCTSNTQCSECLSGYILNPGKSSCLPCPDNCIQCTNATDCTLCSYGYYLNNTGQCQVCAPGCLTCTSASACSLCLDLYTKVNSTCQLCQQLLPGCQYCTVPSACQTCLNGYYLTPGNSCLPCRTLLQGCDYCNSSSICVRCQPGYYLSGTLCLKCETSITGCQVCKSSSACAVCQAGYYLTGGMVCMLCEVLVPGCVSCNNVGQCRDCSQGYALDGSVCRLCKAGVSGCFSCANLTTCDQCLSGYYLNTTDYHCYPCSIIGCQICLQTNASQCLTCNSMYYLSPSSQACMFCLDSLPGCLQCSSALACTDCHPGYYLNSSTQTCLLCQSMLPGCHRCHDSTSCMQCQSTHYLNSTQCLPCGSTILGCTYCASASECVACAVDYYLNASTLACELCTNMDGCLACSDWDTCVICRAGYYLNAATVCASCGVLQGCYSCVSATVCSVCKSGYVLGNDLTCTLFRVYADEAIQGVKFYTEYVDKDTLRHQLLVNQLTYNPLNYTLQEWQSAVTLTLQYPNFTLQQLTVMSVSLPSDSQLSLTTNNPTQLTLSQLPSRLLLPALPQGYRTYIDLRQQTVNQLLPELMLGRNLVVQYDLVGAQFYASITAQQITSSVYYSIFGMCAVVLLLINYLIGAVVTCQHRPPQQHGQLLPHILAMKAPIFVIYPLFPQQVGYCYGFMVVEMPWLREQLTALLADISEYVPQQYAVLYGSMGLGAVYALPLMVGVLGIAAMYVYRWLQARKDKKDKASEYEEYSQQQMSSSYLLPDYPLKHLMYNTFLFGLVFACCASLQSAIYNPIQSLTLHSFLTMCGICLLCLSLVLSLHSLYLDPCNFYQLRIWIKAVLLSFAHIAPMYLFSTALLVDMLCLVIQYRLAIWESKQRWLYLLTNVLGNVGVGVLVYAHSHVATLVVVSVVVGVVMAAEAWGHYLDWRDGQGSRDPVRGVKEYRLHEKSMETVQGEQVWSFGQEQGKEVGEYKEGGLGVQGEEQVKEVQPAEINFKARTKRSKKIFSNTAMKMTSKESASHDIDIIYDGSGASSQDPQLFVASDFLQQIK